MFYLRLILTSFRSLDTHFLRSLLATVGVLIGVASVVACMSLLEGFSSDITKRFKSLGSNVVYVFPEAARIEGRPVGFAQTLIPDDIEILKRELGTKISRVAAEAFESPVNVKYYQRSGQFTLVATNREYFDTNAFEPAQGRIFSQSEAEDDSSAVVCIGAKVAEKLFGGTDPVGQVIKIGSNSYRIVGVMEKKGSLSFIDADQSIFVPLNSALKRHFNRKWLNRITIEAAQVDKLDDLKKQVTTVLRTSHKIRPGEALDFTVANQQEALDNVNGAMLVFKVVFYSIAGISLIVGGIGIMNIMLVSVTERTREIGVRMAVGARRGDILLQFLVEALVISLIGGGLGLLMGAMLSDIMGNVLKSMNFKTEISPMIIMVALVTSTVVGVFSGLYPAWKASRLDPVDALRYE